MAFLYIEIFAGAYSRKYSITAISYCTKGTEKQQNKTETLSLLRKIKPMFLFESILSCPQGTSLPDQKHCLNMTEESPLPCHFNLRVFFIKWELKSYAKMRTWKNFMLHSNLVWRRGGLILSALDSGLGGLG